MSELIYDIAGLDAVSAWPLAMGWWVCIAVGIFLIAAAIWLSWRRLRYVRSWKGDAIKKLDHLARNLSSTTAAETIVTLSEYLRRIAVRRFPRTECAGLVGRAWLLWLQTHDPKKFDWTNHGKLLIEIPYAPAHQEPPLQQVRELIQAARQWVY